MTIKNAFLGLMFLCVSSCGSEEPTTSAVTGDGGITVSSNKLVSASSTDFCTEYVGETCQFKGGQRIKFNDGSILLLGVWQYQYSNGGDTDTNENSISIWVPSNIAVSYQTLSHYVARGAGYKRTYLVYFRSTDVVAVYHDTDNDGVYLGNGGDTNLYTATLSDWGN